MNPTTAEKMEKEFYKVREEHNSGELRKKILQNGKCSYVFTRYGTTNQTCERELGHSGGHMFGISEVKTPEKD